MEVSDYDYTTIQITRGARSKLRELAKREMRSMSSQIEWLIDKAYQVLALDSPCPEDKEVLQSDR